MPSRNNKKKGKKGVGGRSKIKRNAAAAVPPNRPTPGDSGRESRAYTPPEQAMIHTSARRFSCSNQVWVALPDKCAVCFGAFEGGSPTMASCCGSVFCVSCCNRSSQLQYDENGVKLCAVCRKKAPATVRDEFRMLLSAAKMGEAWAQLKVACFFCLGRGVDHSYSEGMHWNRKAAEKGHPMAFVNIGAMYQKGYGCVADPSEAERYYRMAVDLPLELPKAHKHRAAKLLAQLLADDGRRVEARDLLLRVATEGNADIQFKLGECLLEDENDEEAFTWHRAAAIQGHSQAAQHLGANYMRLGRHALAYFWMDVLVKMGVLTDERKEMLAPALKRDREHCGACDERLGTPNQNRCEQCRTYCYCTRLCQIRHWNRGHRNDCKEVGRLKKEKGQLIERFKNEPSDWFD